MKRQIMRDFSIDEISVVDNPAQEGAKMVIMKRSPTFAELEKQFAKMRADIAALREDDDEDDTDDDDTDEDEDDEMAERARIGKFTTFEAAFKYYRDELKFSGTEAMRKVHDNYPTLYQKYQSGAAEAYAKAIERAFPSNEFKKVRAAWESACDEIRKSRGLTRIEAMRETRRQYPALYDDLQFTS